mgnify:CR=1 FL=1
MGTMSFLLKTREKTAKSIIENLEKRNMKGYYCNTKEECAELILSLLNKGDTVTWGGSESLKQCGIPSLVKQSGEYNVLDRAEYTPETIRSYYEKAFSANAYLMGTNAITLDGILVNIDGEGNRVSSLIFGPEKVFVIAGMNKVVTHAGEALDRIRNIASPPNTIRLNKNTPCSKTGKCGNCLSPDCICSQIVYTRRSRAQGRIQVILVGESLGF